MLSLIGEVSVDLILAVLMLQTKLHPQDSHDKNGSHQSGSSRVPLGPTCYYSKQKGHVKTECPALAKMTRQNAIVAPPRLKDVDLNPDVIGQEKIPDVYRPFVSHGTISLVGSVEERPVTILRDTGIPVSRTRVSYPFQINQRQDLMCCCRVWN